MIYFQNTIKHLHVREFKITFSKYSWNFPRGPVVKNPPANAEYMGLTPDMGIKITHATEQLSPCAETTESLGCN